MLEVSGQQGHREGLRVPNDEAVVTRAPRHDVVSRRVVHNLVGLGEERGGPASWRPSIGCGAGMPEPP